MVVLSSPAPDGPGLYLTNEVFLYRVIGVAASDTGDMVDLEDCYSLDVVRVPVDTLRARRLRVVSATPSQARPGIHPDGRGVASRRAPAR